MFTSLINPIKKVTVAVLVWDLSSVIPWSVRYDAENWWNGVLRNTLECIHFRNAFLTTSHVRWIACHRGMARPQVANVGDGLQIWRVAANMLNKQSRTAEKGWSSSLWFGHGSNNP
jgi:hypothetical protein